MSYDTYHLKPKSVVRSPERSFGLGSSVDPKGVIGVVYMSFGKGFVYVLTEIFLSCTQFYPFLLHKMRNLKITIYVVKISQKMKVKILLDLFNKKVHI